MKAIQKGKRYLDLDSTFYLLSFTFTFSCMRLDLFLKASRLIPRRTLAQKFCEAGLVKVNETEAKSSYSVKQDDEIEIKKPNRLIKVRVTKVPEKKQVSKKDSATLYEIISTKDLTDDLFD